MAGRGYTLGEKLLDARASVLYRARTEEGHSLVLKVIDPARSGPLDLERLSNEYEIGRTLDRSVVVEPLRLSSYDGQPALELADAPGAPLERLAEALGPMPIDTFLRAAVRIAAAVAEIHARGIVHRDLKPANIFYDCASDEVRITGFGIASRIAHEQTALRPLRLIEGSLPYISPEQTGRMNRMTDCRSDLYSLGVTFYQLLTGQLPFHASDALGWVHAHVARKPSPPSQRSAHVPGVLSEIVLRLLAKRPDDRYQSAAGLHHDLSRCLTEWSQTGRILAFSLGEHDVSERFSVPQRLYGRETECAVLREALIGATGAGCELVLVSGYSGIGKSAVVHELQRAIVGQRGLFLAGKFEQYKRDIPYFTIAQAFRELILDLLTESEEQIAAWRGRIAAALGLNGQLIVELIPQVGLVIGPQPPIPPLPPNEAENRLRSVFRRFLGVFAADRCPLVLFLDDLQWADAASLALLTDLMTSGDARHLLVIGGYRDNEVDPAHPLLRALAAVRASGAPVRDLVLTPLSEADLGRLVADTVHCSTAEAASLTRVVHDKTGGNPFFAIQFLTTLYHEGLIAFDGGARRWRWDAARIAAQGYTDNVVELMIGKLRELPAPTQEALKTAAAIGATFDAETLSWVMHGDAGPALRVAQEAELLSLLGRSYRFAHDRVQEAAYALASEEERVAIHLQIGRLLLARTPPEALDERCFEIVSQLNRCPALLAEPGEQERVAELNLVAAKRARASTAYASALQYCAAGLALLPANRWERHYELSFALELRLAECEYLAGAMESADVRLGMLMRRARDVVDAAAVTLVREDLYTTVGRGDKGVAACLEYLARVGICWSPHPSDDEVEREYQALWQALGERSIEALADLPSVADPQWRGTMDVLSATQAAAYFTDENLHCLMVGRIVNLSLQHGNSDGSCLAYAGLGIVLGPRFGDYRAGFRFGQLGFDLTARPGLLRFRARVQFVFAALVNHWTRHVRTSVDLVRGAFAAAEASGELLFASNCCNHLVALLLLQGEPLGQVQREADGGLEFLRKAKFGLVDLLVVSRQLIRMLRGHTPVFGALNDDGFDERETEQRLEAVPQLAVAACVYWIRKLQARCLSGDYAAALEAAAHAQPYFWTATGFVEKAEYHLYRALALAACHDAVPPGERARVREQLLFDRRQLEVWAENCPDNFTHRAALVAAELARIDGDAERAAELYERSIERARGFLADEALAYEVASRFHRARGFALIADTYLREARDRYLRWGAEGKARQLERLHPRLVERPRVDTAATVALRAEQLDLLSVVKGSQTISGAMVRDDLLRTLLQAVLEQGGATRGLVVLARDPGLAVGAEATADAIEVFVEAVEVTSVRAPLSVLQWGQRTHERVLLDDASVDAGRFADDDYLARARVRSVLCLPVRRQAELVALLYLENDLSPGAFTPERLLALELLASQAAISLENVFLLERERAGRAQAEAAGRRALLLGEVTALMSSTPDYEAMFSELTRLCVRWLADWAIIDLMEGGRTARLAGAHRDRDKEPLLRELSERYPARIGSSTPGAIAFAAGAPLHLRDISDVQLRASCVDERHRELIAGLGTRSGVIVPLVARDLRLGALTLGAATPHHFSDADVELVVEMGRRAALAIDNARLLRETQRAVELRDEFLSVASHELRTPIASLKLAAELLVQAAEGGVVLSQERIHRSLDRVLRKADRLSDLASQLLDVTRIEQGALELNPTEVELGELVREAAGHFELELATAGCPLSIDCVAPVVGSWDAPRLEQVVTNLITNAIKFGPGRPIEIAVRGAGSKAVLEVRDHGIGIDPARLPHVFERFERAVSWANYGGLGLGLYIVRWVVRAHGGTIRAASKLGEGSTFTIELPRRPLFRVEAAS